MKNGNFEKVKSCLGRNWSITGTVILGNKKASKMQFPTANIIPPDLILPKKGVYVVRAQYEDKTFNGIANLASMVCGKDLSQLNFHR